MRVFRDLLIMTGGGQSGLGVSWNAGRHGRQRKNQTSRHRAHLRFHWRMRLELFGTPAPELAQPVDCFRSGGDHLLTHAATGDRHGVVHGRGDDEPAFRD